MIQEAVLGTLFQKKETIKFPKIEKPWWTNLVSNPDHVVVIPWTARDGADKWNETCALVLEVFGLPGQRLYFSPRESNMLFTFKNKKDAKLCRILLSERM